MAVEIEPLPCHSPLVQRSRNLRLENARSAMDLLVALRDVASALKQLFVEHQILHRHITYDNVLIRSGADSGVAGVVVDLDFPNPTEGSSRTSTGLGLCDSLAFQSAKRLTNRVSHAHKHTLQEDLESLFCVLCWTCYGYDHTGGPDKYRPDWMETWITTRHAETAAPKKKSFLSTPSSSHINRYIGCQRDIMEDIIEQLRQTVKRNSSDPEKDCARFLTVVEEGIEEIRGERCGCVLQCNKALPSVVPCKPSELATTNSPDCIA
ncbi:hypothetical protein B0H16DRAFT_1503305 [Mycena metata]|uniref:Fungal-type protein kinase domain-containing protein n=1 Tax=Mycena metata TaxID=1033252 RepID=A0AAD7NW38_9AGAR|nr:hypothetical protein B0H16DRAFT_1503305 [Mycena metata]